MANSREMAEKAFSLLQDALTDSESRAAELDTELKKKRTPKNKLEKQSKVLEHRLETAETEFESSKADVARLEELLENERVKIQQLKKKLEVAESGPDKVGKKEVNYWRARAEQIDEETKKYKKRIAELRKSLKQRPDSKAADTAKAAETADTAKTDKLAKDRDAKIGALTSKTAELKSQLSDSNTLVEDLKSQNNQLNSDLADKNSELTEQAAQLNGQLTSVSEKDKALSERDQRIVELAESQRVADEAKLAVRDQIAGLEEELKEEKECTVNLSEIANERREQITDLSEKLDEAQERYEEAKWRLERASRFERLVTKRRSLIDSLIAGHRAKYKSNAALKAGLDGLRKFKAKSEQQQQKMRVRIDELSSELKEAEGRLANRSSSKKADEKLKKSLERVSSLEDRLKSQVEIIENLESELNAAKATRQTTENRNKELAELKTMLEARNETITGLEADLDEQQKQLGKLRGSESETLRLKAVQEKDQSLIDEMQSKIDSLAAQLEQQEKLADGGAKDAAATSGAEIRKRDSQISDLKRSVKDQEKEIAKLNEAVAGWQKKYEFLSTEAPSAYQSAAAEK